MSIRIAGLQKLSLLDFPGRVACTVFLAGCNLRCPFCHNASLVLTGEHTDSMDEESFFSFLKKRQGILDGVCVTGGEPLLQPSVTDFLARIRDLGYLVKLDTNGTLPERLKPILEAKTVDYVAMDIKSSPSGYASAVGVASNVDNIYESIAMVKSSGISHEFRSTVVKGLHTREDIAEMAKMAGDSPYFLQGFIDSGDLINGNGLSAFSAEEMNELCAVAKQYAPLCQVRGV